MAGETGYYVREWSDGRATIHHESCRSVRFRTPTTTNGQWHGPFLSSDDAAHFAQRLRGTP